MRTFFRSGKFIVGMIGIIQLPGCGFGYYWQATRGHLELMDSRRPVGEVIADSAVPDSLREKLSNTMAVLEFAHDDLGLPDNGSYTFYADTGRNYVVWNVFAAGEFSLAPRGWCFLVIGCISYRGYFDEAQARDFAAGLAEQGDDIFVGGVTAYSTLGRFADPLLNTMMDLTEPHVAALIFHELAHQQVYIKDDSMFNEGFASFVEREGLFRWLQATGTPDDVCAYIEQLGRRAQVRDLLQQARTELADLYVTEQELSAKRRAKQAVFRELDRKYQALRQTWSGPPYFDGWFRGELNNARLVALSVYDDYVPAFAELLRRDENDLRAFYAHAAQLGASPANDRQQAINLLLNAAKANREFNGLPFFEGCPVVVGL
jgi:predicted aminopeptidase